MKHPMLAVIFLSCLTACSDDEGDDAITPIDGGENPGIDSSVEQPDASPPGTPDAGGNGEDLDMKAEDFECLKNGTPAGEGKLYFVWNKLDHLDDALAVANAPGGGTFPVGTILQLIPQEAMVKRRAGWNPATKDWEFFALETSATGTTIKSRGTETVNFQGDNCSSCHSAAQPQFDLVCEKTHGCDPLGTALKAAVPATIEVLERPMHAEDPAFVGEAVDRLIGLIEAGTAKPRRRGPSRSRR